MKKKSKKSSWGGVRKGAGRKKIPGTVSHMARPAVKPSDLMLVKFRRYNGLDEEDLDSCPNFRAVAGVVLAQVHNGSKAGFKVQRAIVEPNDIEIIVRAADERQLSRGAQGLGVRIARNINSTVGRTGKVFAVRYEATKLTPAAKREVTARFDKVKKTTKRFELTL